VSDDFADEFRTVDKGVEDCYPSYDSPPEYCLACLRSMGSIPLERRIARLGVFGRFRSVHGVFGRDLEQVVPRCSYRLMKGRREPVDTICELMGWEPAARGLMYSRVIIACLAKYIFNISLALFVGIDRDVWHITVVIRHLD